LGITAKVIAMPFFLDDQVEEDVWKVGMPDGKSMQYWKYCMQV
jgi:hypothetical protein